VHNAATGVIRPAPRDRGQALGLDDERECGGRACSRFARATGAADDGRLVHRRDPSSLGSQRVLENYVLVGTSKAALEAVVPLPSRSSSRPVSRVNAVSGGVVDTGALEHFPNKEEMLSLGRGRTPAGRLVATGDNRRCRFLSLLAPTPRWCAGQTPHRRRRVLAPGLMEPTDLKNRRAFDALHRNRGGPRVPDCRRS